MTRRWASLLSGPLRRPTQNFRGTWRTRNWEKISRETYAEAFQMLGGSIHAHPEVVSLAASIAGRQLRFIAQRHDGAVIAALPVLGDALGITTEATLRFGTLGQLDLGNSEVILPVRADARVRLPLATAGLSNLHAANLLDLKPDHRQHMLARPYHYGENPLSPETLGKRRREHRQFIKHGGVALRACTMAPEDLASAFIRLFRMRWGDSLYVAQAELALPKVLSRLKPLIRGSILMINDSPVALDIIYAHPTPHGLLAVGVNGAADPSHRALSPGSVLKYLNGLELEEEAQALGMPLRYSFGYDDNEYKKLWCHSQPLYVVT